MEACHLSFEEIGKMTLYQARMLSVEVDDLRGKKKMTLAEAQRRGIVPEKAPRARRLSRRKRGDKLNDD